MFVFELRICYFCIMSLKDITQIISALLVPVIGITTVYIAYQQHNLAKQQHLLLKLKTRLDLFEKRSAIYIHIMELLAKIGRDAKIDIATLLEFLRKTKDNEFLFEKEIASHIDEIYKKGIQLQYYSARLYDHRGLPVGDERTKLAEKCGELLGWFSGQFQVTREKFKQYNGCK